jgi:hypothetical protein
LTEYLFYVLKNQQNKIYEKQQGPKRSRVHLSALNNIEIPLLPVKEQQEIVDELDDYWRIIEGAGQLIDNWRPRIKNKLNSLNTLWQREEREPVADKLVFDILLTRLPNLYSYKHTPLYKFKDR